MYDKEDFFSPEQVDEQLDLSLRQRNPGVRGQRSGASDPNLYLVDDLRFLYGAEGTENARSLQRVWDRLAEQRTSGQTAILPPILQNRPQLHLVKQATPTAPAPAKRRSAPGSALAALAAVLFLVIMVGSLLAIVHFTRKTPLNSNAAGKTPTTQPQWTPVAGYPYPTPGKTSFISPAQAGGFFSLTWSPDNQHVAASAQGVVWIWGMVGNTPSYLLFDPQAGNVPVVLAWNPGAPRLAVGTSHVQMIDPGNGNVLPFHYPALASEPSGNSAARVTALAWSPDGKFLAVAGHDPVAGNEVSIWEVNSGKLLYTFSGQRAGDAITSLSWSSDGRYVASANGQSVQAWDARIGALIFQHAINAPTEVVWSPSADNAGDLAFVSNGSTQVWYMWKSQPAGTLVSSYPNTPNGVLSWSPDGHYLATASGHNVIIFNAATGGYLYTYSGDSRTICSVAWSPDGSSLASSESGSVGPNRIRVWSA